MYRNIRECGVRVAFAALAALAAPALAQSSATAPPPTLAKRSGFAAGAADRSLSESF